MGAWLLAALLLPAALPCRGQDAPGPQNLIIAGSQGSSENSYSYFGTLTPMWGGRLGHGWFRKTIGSWLTYRFDKVLPGDSAATEIRAQAPGLEAGLGHAWDLGATTGDLSLSLGVRHTRLRPDAPDAASGTDLMLTPQGFVRHAFGQALDAEVLASYSFGTKGRFVRTRVGTKALPRWRVGLEGALAAGPDYRSVQRGLFAGTDLGATGLHVDINAGRARARDGQQSDYLGLSLSKTW